MGRFVNPGNAGFKAVLANEIYVDKTEILAYINRRLGSQDAFFCNSRPRRFGKSTTVHMLKAYYDRSCASEELFAALKIAQEPSFKQQLNKYDVICIDVQSVKLQVGAEQVVGYLQREIVKELQALYPDLELSNTASLQEALIVINKATGMRFAIIMDEWDCIIRDDIKKLQAQEEFLSFLRSIFKCLEAAEYMAFAYLTGIFPIKKYNTQSALNNFKEYTMLNPGPFAQHIGFTEDEVHALCKQYHLDFTQLRRWYDGYLLGNQHIYNPCSVVNAMYEGLYQSYWSQTGTFATIQMLIDMNFVGLKQAVASMLAGTAVAVNVRGFRNDMSIFQNKDDVLTALIHLGYLTYDSMNRRTYIPNEEIREEFEIAITNSAEWKDIQSLLATSQALVKSCWLQDGTAVASAVDKVHEEYSSIIKYNDENALASVLSIAFLGAMPHYYRPVREMPAGKGFADLVFFPKREYPEVPAMVVELKWNKDAAAALQQIKERSYPAALSDYTGRVLLVGINYDKTSKAHSCIIEAWEK